MEQESHTTVQKDAPPVWRKEALKSLLWIALVVGGIYYVAHEYGFEEIRLWVEGAGIWGPLVLIALKASTLVFAPLGGSPLYPIAGALFGTQHGVLYVLLGDAIGATICFFISRWYGMRVAQYFLGEAGMTYLHRILSHMGTTRGFLEARVFFIALPEGVAYAAGLTTLAYWKFILIHMSVALVPTVLYVALGDLLLSGHPGFVLLGAGAFSLLGLVGMYWLYKKANTPAV